MYIVKYRPENRNSEKQCLYLKSVHILVNTLNNKYIKNSYISYRYPNFLFGYAQPLALPPLVNTFF